MTACCNNACQAPTSARYRRVLWAALAINLLMFVVEIAAGVRSGSVSLLADAVDFAGDAANYGISLLVLGMGLAWRARAALLKGASMAAFGLFVVARTAWGALAGLPPEALTMGLIGLLALLANGLVMLLLYAFRDGDANRRSVWLCSRNDALGNIAVMLAAAGVFGTGTAWPDLAVAAIMAGLSLSSGCAVIRQAWRELRPPVASMKKT
jgi:Co/Zn/Cd efflux system component